MVGSIFLFGLLALSFAGLSGSSYGYLTASSVLYCAMTTVQGVYTVIEASYIPIFMRSVGWYKPRLRMESPDSSRSDPEVEMAKRSFTKGARVSVLGLITSNVGGLTALLIGIVITYTRVSYVTAGYQK
jgi:Vacuole effluxer Atg22 like